MSALAIGHLLPLYLQPISLAAPNYSTTRHFETVCEKMLSELYNIHYRGTCVDLKQPVLNRCPRFPYRKEQMYFVAHTRNIESESLSRSRFALKTLPFLKDALLRGNPLRGSSRK